MSAYEEWAEQMVTNAELGIPLRNGHPVSTQTLADIVASLSEKSRIRMRASVVLANRGVRKVIVER